jgi:hypothetical protein
VRYCRPTAEPRLHCLNMKKGLALLVTAALALSLSALMAPSAVARYCGTVTGPEHHAFFLQTKRKSCKSAKRIVDRWLDDRPSSSSKGPSGWRCRHNYAGDWRCTRRGATLKFNLHTRS